MLVPAIVGNTNSLVSARQVVAQSSTLFSVMYTVPTGKKFVGTAHADTTGSAIGITPSGGSSTNLSLPALTTSYATVAPLPITLIAGTTVTCQTSGSAVYLMGVESDL